MRAKAPITIDGTQYTMVVRSRDSNSYPFVVKLEGTMLGFMTYCQASEICKKRTIKRKAKNMVRRELNEEDELQETLNEAVSELAQEEERVSQ